MNNSKLLNRTFFIAISIICFFVIVFPPANILSYDVFGYYLYLPMGFNYNDLTIHNYSTIDTILNTYHSSDTFYQAYKLENGNWVMKYSMGMSVMYAPFYFIGHFIAKYFGFSDDGFSKPYQLSILYGCLIYTIIGLYYFKKILAEFFTQKNAAIVFVLIVFGTNYFFHVSIHGQGAMTHNVLFSLYAFVLWYTIKWYQNFKLKYLFFVGLGIGLMTLIRPTEIIALIIPLLYKVTSISSFKERCVLVLKTHNIQFFILFTLVGVLLSYQLVYFKILTGTFLFNSYEAINPGEGFEFSHPYILEVLFSFRKGWFIYTPIMLLALVGFIYLYKNKREFFFPAMIYFLINLYIISSWSCWWYAGSFSSRALIPSYVLMAIPLGYLLVKVLSGKFKMAMYSVLILIVCLNLFQSWQVKAGILDTTNMSRAYYKSVFFQTSQPTEEQRKLLLVNKFSTISETFTKEDSLTHVLGFSKEESFETIEKKENYTIDTLVHSGKQAILTSETYEFGPAIDLSYETITDKSYTWIKASIWFYTTHNPDELDGGLNVNMSHEDHAFKYRETKMSGKGFKANQWNKIEFYYMTPDIRSTKDKVKLFFWNRSKHPVFVDDLKLESFEPLQDKSVF